MTCATRSKSHTVVVGVVGERDQWEGLVTHTIAYLLQLRVDQRPATNFNRGAGEKGGVPVGTAEHSS